MSIPWSTIVQDETTRAVVQEGILTRAIHDPLFPRLLYRADVPFENWPANIGDSQIFTGSGLMKKRGRRRQPGIDPQSETYGFEQWAATIGRYDGSTDIHHPTDVRSIVRLALQKAAILGASSGMTLDAQVRNRLYAAGLSGNTYATTTQGVANVSLPVACLFGFHEARKNGTVKYTAPSANNPLAITIGSTAAVVVGFAQDNPEPEGIFGSGTLTLQVAKTWTINDPVKSSDASPIVRAGGGASMHSLDASNKLTLSLVRQVVAEMEQNNVPRHEDGYYHCHLSPASEAQLYDDAEWRNIHTAAYDAMSYKELIIGVKFGVIFFRNTQSPQAGTVQDTGVGTGFDIDDAFPGGPAVLTNKDSVAVHRLLITGREACYEKFSDPDLLVSEVGVTGKVGWFDISLNNIQVVTDRIKFIWRAPLNKTQDISDMTWLFDGDWAIRTDSLTGSTARYKRTRVIEHA